MKARRIRTDRIRGRAIEYRRDKRPSLASLRRAEAAGLDHDSALLGLASLAMRGYSPALFRFLDIVDTDPTAAAIMGTPAPMVHELIKTWRPGQE